MYVEFTKEDNSGYYTACLPESASVYEVMEAISGLLLTTGFNYLSIIKAHEDEVSRMNEAIEREGGDDEG